MGKMNVFTIVIALCIWSECNGQENTQTRIPSSLAECYTTPDILNRDSRLPMNINMLIELIRKIEDSPGFMQDIRVLSTSLVHRFRLDGIERAPGVFQSNAVLPFSPSAFQFSKHRLLLSRLVPGNAFTFPNNTLTPLERVSVLDALICVSIESSSLLLIMKCNAFFASLQLVYAAFYALKLDRHTGARRRGDTLWPIASTTCDAPTNRRTLRRETLATQCEF